MYAEGVDTISDWLSSVLFVCWLASLFPGWGDRKMNPTPGVDFEVVEKAAEWSCLPLLYSPASKVSNCLRRMPVFRSCPWGPVVRSTWWLRPRRLCNLNRPCFPTKSSPITYPLAVPSNGLRVNQSPRFTRRRHQDQSDLPARLKSIQ